MEKSSFFNSVNGDRRYKATDFAEYFASIIGNGVFPNPSTNLQVIANNNMTVAIKPGKAWINGYFYINTNDLILNIDPADGVLNRIDRIVLRLDFVKREIRAVIKKGDIATNAVVKTLQRDADCYELALADITVNKGTISITQSIISDLRLNKDLCGIVKGTIEEIDVTTLFNQYNAKLGEKIKELDNEFITWFKTIEKQVEGNAIINLANEITKIKTDVIGEEELNTNKKTVKGAINELKNNTDTDVKQSISKISENLNTINNNLGNSIGQIKKNLDDSNSRLSESIKTSTNNAQNGINELRNQLQQPTKIPTSQPALQEGSIWIS